MAPQLSFIDGLSPRGVVRGNLAAIALLGALGTAYALAKTSDPGTQPLLRSLPIGLNEEYSLPAVYSALLLLCGGLATWRAGRVTDGHGWPFAAVGALLVFMAADEGFVLHERIEAWAGGISWLYLYAPLFLLSGVGWLLVLQRLRGDLRAALCWVGGAAAWFLSQVLELFQYVDGVLVRRWSILPEELLEMSGSLLFLLAMLIVVRDRAAQPDAGVQPFPARRAAAG